LDFTGNPQDLLGFIFEVLKIPWEFIGDHLESIRNPKEILRNPYELLDIP